MMLDAALACLLVALAFFAFLASALAFFFHKTPRMLSKLPPNRRKLWAVGGLLVAAGCLVKGLAELSAASFLGFAGSLLLLTGILLTLVVRQRHAV
jgi:hypothetical protein